jgi:transcriptional regulator with XRE-family HTH domain
MGTRDRPIDRARRLARSSAFAFGNELRLARIGANLSQQTLGDLAGKSRTKVGRIEHGDVKSTLEDLWALSVPLGLEFSGRFYPAGDPVRDKGQRALLERLQARINPALRWRTEVPFPNHGDLRAWDAVISGTTWSCAVEAETRLADLQALDRKLAIKQRDGLIDLLVLLVADTRHNRAVLRTGQEALSGRLPIDPGTILTALIEGREPPGSGILVL